MVADVGTKIDPEKCIRIAHDAADANALNKLEKELAALPKRGLQPISVIPEPEEDGEAGMASWDRQLVDPAIIELLLSLDLPIRIPKGDPKSFTFWLDGWTRREACELDELRRVAEHPFFGEVLVTSFFATRETKSEVGNWLARAVRSPDSFARVFAALDAFGKTLGDTWTVGALEVHEKWLENVCQPAVFERCPALARAVRELEPWRLLRNQLRAGVMDEWGWPAYEEALDRFPPKDQHDIATDANTGVLPYKVFIDSKRGRVIVVAPDRIVMDRPFPAAKKLKDVRQAMYVGDDVLICEYKPMQSRWVVAGGAPFKMDPYNMRNVGYDGGVITWARTVMRPGDRKPGKPKELRGTHRIWCDGSTYYGVPQETCVHKDGTPVGKERQGCEAFDPKTGKTTGNALPAWMAELVGDGELFVEIDASFTSPAPKGAERSPLGAKDGLGGFALYARDHAMFIEGIDGRKANGLVNGLHTVALMTFPEREGFYPIVQSAFDLGIALPDGTPLVPMDRLKWSYWQGTPGLGALVDWLSLVPRDPKASRALSKCSDEAAKAIYAAARPPEEDDEWDVVPKELTAAVTRAIPEVRHPRLVVGIAGLAKMALRCAAIVMRLKSRAKPPGPMSSLTNDQAGALSRLFEHDRHWWVEKLGVQLGQQMLDVSHFLFDDELASNVVTPAPTVVPWPLLLERMGEVLYRIIAPGTPKARRAELTKVLELWLDTGFPTSLPRVRMVALAMSPKREELAGLDRDHSQRLVAWKSRYFLHFAGLEKGVMKLSGVEVARTKDFVVPEGAKLESTRPVDARWDAATIRKTLALFAGRGPAPYDRAIVELLAKKAKLSKTAATLLWSAGYDPWFIGDAKQARFEIARDDIDPAEKELKKLSLSEIYAPAMPDDPAQMYDGAVMAERLANAIPIRSHEGRQAPRSPKPRARQR